MLSGSKTFLHISYVFLLILDRKFSFFCFLLIFDWELSLFSFFLLLSFCLFSSKSKDGHSHPGSRFMVSWHFGLRFVEQLDMTYVRVWFGSGIKGDVPYYFHDTNATMMIWKFYAKLVMHAPMWTLKCRKIFGHVIVGPCDLNNLKRDRLRMQKKQQQSI